MKRFFNQPEAIVTQAFDGALRVHGRQLSRADAYPHTKFVVRGDWDKTRVAVISGGGAGHEPAHAGYVGKGMLTAAVSGEVFASPSVEAVLACVLEVTGDAGCLLIVKNYTGDRLNFGLAAERAKKMGKKVEMIIVGDDIAIPGAPQPRGIAGTLFVHKVAGYLADQGESLETIKAKVDEVEHNCLSLGLALSTCILPGLEPSQLAENPELGLGIHGEPGVEKIGVANGEEAVAIMLNRLQSQTDPSSEYAVIINNLGSVTPLEMFIITDEVLASDFGRQIKLVIGPDQMMTSLNMYGFSLSLLKLTSELETIITFPVEPRAWRQAVVPAKPTLINIDHLEIRQKFEPGENDRMRNFVREACAVLLASEQALNELDDKVGDGDAGFTFANAARAVKEQLDADKLPLNNVEQLFLAIGELLASAMGGSSGVLNSIMFTNAGAGMAAGLDWAPALESGIEMMMTYGGAKQGDRTMLDALIPAVEKLKAGDLAGAAAAARAGANATAQMTRAKAGRSSYLRADSLEGVIDPGSEAIARVFEHLASKF